MKKVLTIILTLTLLLSLSTFALAAELKFDFGSGVDGWSGQEATTGEHGEGATEVASENGLLKGTMKAGDVKYSFIGPAADVNPGDTVTLYVYLFEDTLMKGMQTFRQDQGWDWENSKWVNVEGGTWHEVTWTIPEGKTPFQKFGLQVTAADEDTALTADEVIYITSEEGADAPVAPPADDDDDEEPAKTGYGSMLPLILMAGASGAVLIKRRKK